MADIDSSSPPPTSSIDEELDKWLLEGDPRTTAAQLAGGHEEGSDSGTGSLFPTPTTQGSPGLQSARTNAVLHAKRVANRLSLGGPYSRDLEAFVVEDPDVRCVLMYAKLLAVEQKVSNITSTQGSYTVSKALMDNIKSVSYAVLLSPKLATYRGSAVWKRVVAVLKQLEVTLPSNFSTDRNVLNSISEAIINELTQARSKIKKAIGLTLKSKESIYELASGLIQNTQCIVTVALCARLALLRRVLSEPQHSGQKYWKFVNERLEKFRLKADGAEDKLQILFATTLAQDRQTYGTAQQNTIQSQSTNEWNSTIDQAMNQPSNVTQTLANDDDEEAD